MIARAAGALADLASARPGLCAAVLGLLTGLGHAPLETPFFLILAAPLMVALMLSTVSADRPGRRGFRVGWAFGVGHYLMTFYWIGFAFLVDAGTLVLMPFMMAALIAGVALFPAIAGLIFAKTVRPRGPLAGAFAFAGLFAAADLARSVLFGGFPWALPGMVWGPGSPIAQIVSIIGLQGLSLVSLLGAGLIATVFAERRRIRPIGPVLGTALFAGLYAFGSMRSASAPIDDQDLRVRVVRTQIPQDLKWDAERALANFRRLLDLTATRRDGDDAPDLVVWPESSVGFRLLDEEVLLRAAAQAAGEAHLVAGSIRLDIRSAEDFDAYNSLIVVSSEDGAPVVRAVYDKRHLVPFGEYVPGPRALVELGLKAVNQSNRSGLAPGEGPSTLLLDGVGAFTPLICYEILFPHLVPRGEGRPDFLIQASNDGWFGDTTGPNHHFSHARFRAIETGLPVLRAANNGVAAVIDAHGRVRSQAREKAFSFAEARLPKPLPPTFFETFRDMIGWLLALTCTAMGFHRLSKTDQKL